MAETQKRRTHQRKMVYDEVLSRCDHPSADDIYISVRARDSQISRGTVYRNLNVLSEMGKIEHINAPGSDRFDRRTDRHYHIICTQCGKVVDAPVEYAADNDASAAAGTGYRIDGHNTIFEGICPDCQ